MEPVSPFFTESEEEPGLRSRQKRRSRAKILYDELIHTPLAGATMHTSESSRYTIFIYSALYAAMLASVFGLCFLTGWIYEHIFYPTSNSPLYIVALEGFVMLLSFATVVLHIKFLQLFLQYFCRPASNNFN